MGWRGPRCPLLVISDGAAGLVGAIERAFPQALRQRCLVHRARNIPAKPRKYAKAELKAAYWEIFEVPEEVASGLEAASLVKRRPRDVNRPPVIPCPALPSRAALIASRTARKHIAKRPPRRQGLRPSYVAVSTTDPVLYVTA